MSNQTPIGELSAAGADRLHEMEENPQIYIDFLKFHGRVFKHDVDVSLEFFTQRPKTEFIATQKQWESANFHVGQGEEAIRFIDREGRTVDYYDFSQVDEEIPPPLWAINTQNAGIVKSGLGIDSNKPLITGIINQTITTGHIAA